RQLELVQQATQRQNAVKTCEDRLDLKQREREGLRARSNLHADSLTSLERELEELSLAEADLKERKGQAQQASAEKRQERDRLQRLREDTTRLESDLRAERSGGASRIEVLERLGRAHERPENGGPEGFALLEQPNPGPWGTVLGIVADFLTVPREYAPLIDLALGPRASYFIVRDPVLLRAALEQRGQPFSGRVSFYPLPPPHDRRTDFQSVRASRQDRLEIRPTEMPSLMRGRRPMSREGRPAHPGVVALAEQLVTCDHPQLAGLPQRLLADTLIVRDLSAARALAAHTSGYRFVSLQGELMEAD